MTWGGWGDGNVFNALRSELVKLNVCKASWESGEKPELARSGEWGPPHPKATGFFKSWEGVGG